MYKEGKILRTAAFMVFATLAAKICGMLRDMILAANYGTSVEAVAFATASKAPILLFDLVIGGVVTASFIPVFNETLQKENKESAMQFANDYVNMILLITMAITAFGLLFAKQLIHFLAPSIPEEAATLAVQLSNIMFPMVIFTGLAFCFVGILQSFGEFNIPSIISLVSNLIMIGYFFTFNQKFGIKGLAVAMLIGWGAQAVVQIPSLIRFHYRYRPGLHLKSPRIKQALSLALPILISTWVQPLCTLINTRFASGMENGRAIPALNYANNIYIIIVGVFSFVATNLLFPYLSRANASGEKEKAKQLTVLSLKTLALIILPIMAGFILLSGPVVNLLYGWKNFTSDDVALTATALSFYAVGMIGMAFNEILNKSFFSLQDSKTPMVNSVIGMVVNIIFAVILSKTMGIGGIALASGIAITVNAILNYICMVRKGGPLLGKEDIADLAKIIVSVLVMAAVVYFLKLWSGDMNKFLAVVIPVAGGGIVYAGMALLLRISEVKWLLGLLKKKGKE